MAVPNALTRERGGNPLRAICVTRGLLDAVASEQIDELRDDVIWIERRGTLSRCIDNDGVAVPMTDSAGHRIGRSTRRIGKTEIPHASNRRPLANASINAGLHSAAFHKIR